MNADLKILTDFLDRFGPEVTARQLPEPHPDAEAKLARFASGECNDTERTEVCDMLRVHPAWLRWLADRVKFARSGNYSAAVQ